MKIKKIALILFLGVLLVSAFACAGPEAMPTPTPIPTLTTEESFDYYISQIGDINLELAQELQKLPDFKQVDEADVEALEDILELAQNGYFFEENFDSVLGVGIKEKREYCTPLEALVWLCYDYENDFLNTQPWEEEYQWAGVAPAHRSWTWYAWGNSSISNNYQSERWQDFDEVVSRLNAPKIFGLYMQDNLIYSYTPYEQEGVKSAEQIFNDKGGACYDVALLGGYCLKTNGYDTAQGLAVKFEQPYQGFFIGHIVCVYQDPKDSLYYTINFGSVGGWIFGPFESIEQAAERSCLDVGLKSYSLHDINLQTGKYETTWSWW